MISRYRRYIFLQLLIVLLVILTFRLLPDKRFASVIATSLFMMGAGAVIFLEVKGIGHRVSLSLVSSILFVVLFIIPILIVRVNSWNGSFEAETLLGLTGAQLHRYSNAAFMIMLACYFVESLMEVRLKAKNQNKG